MVQEMKKKKQSQLFKNFINFCQTPILNSIRNKVNFQIRQKKKKDSKGIEVWTYLPYTSFWVLVGYNSNQVSDSGMLKKKSVYRIRI